MSFTRPIYDPCAYSKDLDESTSVLNYVLDPNKHYNCNECRIEFGLVAGNNVSRYEGNMVDLESDLRNQNRLYSRCPSKKYLPKCKKGCKSTTGLPCGDRSCKKDNMYHLPSCQIIQYKPRIDNTGYEINYPKCPAPKEPKERRKLTQLDFKSKCGPGNYTKPDDWKVRDWNSKYAPADFSK